MLVSRCSYVKIFVNLWPVNERFYEKLIKVTADVAALPTFLVLSGLCHISTENFGLGSLRTTTGNSVDPQHSPFCLFPVKPG